LEFTGSGDGRHRGTIVFRTETAALNFIGSNDRNDEVRGLDSHVCPIPDANTHSFAEPEHVARTAIVGEGRHRLNREPTIAGRKASILRYCPAVLFVEPDALVGWPIVDNAAPAQIDHALAHGLDAEHVVRDEDDRR